MKLARSNMLAASHAPAKKMPADPYQAESDYNTVKRASEVHSDKGRKKAALEHGKKELAAHSQAMNVLTGENKKNADPKAKGKVYYSTGK